MLVELGAYDAEAAHNGSGACAYIALAGHVVEVYPAALALYYALGAQHGAVLLPIVQRRKVCLEFVHGKGLGSLHSPAGKHLIGMVMVVMALAFGIVALPAVVMVMMLMLFAVIAVIAVMMVMPAALVLIVVIVMVVMLMPALLPEKLKLCLKGVALFHGLQYLGACQLAPGGDYEGGIRVVLPQQGYIGIQLIRAYLAGAAEYNCVGVLYLGR